MKPKDGLFRLLEPHCSKQRTAIGPYEDEDSEEGVLQMMVFQRLAIYGHSRRCEAESRRVD